jgi:hypothetical protein
MWWAFKSKFSMSKKWGFDDDDDELEGVQLKCNQLCLIELMFIFCADWYSSHVIFNFSSLFSWWCLWGYKVNHCCEASRKLVKLSSIFIFLLVLLASRWIRSSLCIAQITRNNFFIMLLLLILLLLLAREIRI